MSTPAEPADAFRFLARMAEQLGADADSEEGFPGLERMPGHRVEHRRGAKHLGAVPEMADAGRITFSALPTTAGSEDRRQSAPALRTIRSTERRLPTP
jgi:hypothetical protein